MPVYFDTVREKGSLATGLKHCLNTLGFHPTAKGFFRVEFRSCHQKTRAEFQNYPQKNSGENSRDSGENSRDSGENCRGVVFWELGIGFEMCIGEL